MKRLRNALARCRVCPGTRHPPSVLLLAVPVLAYAPAALALPTLCNPTSGNVVCTGNQSAGITGTNNRDFTLSTTTSLTVKDLTQDISVANSGRATGIQWSLTPGFTQTAMPFDFSSADFAAIARSTSGGFAAGIDVESSGSPSDRPGRSVSLDVNGSASATGTGGAAVYGLVTGNTGANGGLVSITVGPPPKSDLSPANGTFSGSGDMTSGIAAIGKGGNGANGEGGGAAAAGDDGGNGGSGATVGVDVTRGNWTITTSGSAAPGALLQSYGGNGGNGGSSTCCNGGYAGKGGQGGTVSFESPSTGQLTIHTGQNDQGSAGLLLISQAGSGGTGGSSDLFGKGGKGGAGGGGGPISVLASHLDVTTDYNSIFSPGLAAYSLGGTGGNGGNGGAFNGGSADGGGTGASGPVTVAIQAGNILTEAANSAGIVAQSVSGHAGTGGAGTVRAANFAAAGGSAGKAGDVSVDNGAAIRTNSDQSVAIFAQSVGGGGGNGGTGFGIFYAQGGNGGNGGDGGAVQVANSGALTTSGADSQGIFAQSVGGAGGDGGNAGSVVAAVGGRATYASRGGPVTVINSGAITTGAPPIVAPKKAEDPICGVGCSEGILAQSIGGGGGEAGYNGAGGTAVGLWFSLGGTGGGGGPGGTVNVTNTGNVVTQVENSPAIDAESIGGGGGNAGGGISTAPLVSVAIGGSGGSGGAGGDVNVQATSGMKIGTGGDNSAGIVAESVGGGGGDGGYAAAIAGGNNITFSVGVGGTGGAGGNGQSVTVNTINRNYSGVRDNITTKGASSDGILAQSTGAGGGNGGFAVAFSAAPKGFTGALAIGGKGNAAGNGGSVSLTSDAQVTTFGDESSGLVAQSIGKGGGNGGLTISGTLNITGVGVSAAIGGSGGGGGSASTVTLRNSGTVKTAGREANGVVAQSLGGGGGNGGVTVAASLVAGGETSGNVSVAVGGNGGIAGNGGQVTLINSAPVTATGPEAFGLDAESVGAAGGNGSLTIAAALAGTNTKELSLAVGGNGGAGGNGGNVTLVNSAAIQTGAAGPTFATAQDILGIAGLGSGLSAEPDLPLDSPGVVASSLGGGGGDGSWAGALSLGLTSGQGTSIQAAVTVGGRGGAGGNAGAVSLENSGSVTTSANVSPALLGSSIGGGGGDAGYLLSGTAIGTGDNALSASVAVGRDGDAGGAGGPVRLTNDGALETFGMDSDAIKARSAGGGGGSAGAVITLNAAVNVPGQVALGVAVGGGGGAGSTAADVTVENSGVLTTKGQNSDGIRAASVGGTGGDGALTLSGGVQLKKGYAGNVAVGGNGGVGDTGGNVTVVSHGLITTTGDNANGIEAQSTGGGGGDALMSVAAPIRTKAALKMSLGGLGGIGANAGDVQVENHSDITATGAQSIGIFAQSTGGGGGASQANNFALSGTGNQLEMDLAVTLGLPGGSSGDAGLVTVANSGVITTGPASAGGVSPDGDVEWNQSGIVARSVGGGGGTGGNALNLIPGISAENDRLAFSVSVGGVGGIGGIGQTVKVTNTGAITTFDTQSYGIAAQSVGGGGGSGGDAAAAPGVLYDKSTSLNIGIAVGGGGGKGNDAGAVTVSNAAGVTTHGDGSHGIFAQSIGGGGGDGGSAFSYFIGGTTKQAATTINLKLSLGGNGGTGGVGKTVNVTNDGTVATTGDGANGIEAQSIGGGGGEAGNASSATMTRFPLQSLNVNVGGQGGTGNNGGTVTITQSSGATTTTTGSGSAGIYAQSVGAGGGRGGAGVYAPVTTLSLGGDGGANGNGGSVTVNEGGTVRTEGSGLSDGIFAQSVGGGGGQAGGIGVGIVDAPYLGPPPVDIGTSIPMGIAGKSSGNGGPVTVTVGTLGGPGSITTTGDDAIGIYAQSVGGGGGIRGQAHDPDTCPAPCSDLVGSLGNTGSAGPVTVKLNGTITTDGAYSHGIFAQSAAGATSPAGNVSVQLSTGGASILANGANADGIFAQSVGGANGAISITVGDGATVRGGTGNSYGVSLLDGASNVLNNAGTITTLNGTNGVAVRTNGGHLTLNNSGSIIGALNINDALLGQAGASAAPERITNTGQIAGNVQIHNVASVIVNGGSGATFGRFGGGAITVANGNLAFARGNTDLGDDISVNGGRGTVVNNGVLRLAAPETITGNFFQTGSGTFDTIIGGDDFGQYGALTVTGLATLEGRLDLDLTNGFSLRAGDRFDLFNFADPGLTSRTADIRALTFDGANCLDAGYDSWSCSDLGSLDLIETISASSLDINIVAAPFLRLVDADPPVPEPPARLMLVTALLGLAGIGVLRRRRNARVEAAAPSAGRSPAPADGGSSFSAAAVPGPR